MCMSIYFIRDLLKLNNKNLYQVAHLTSLEKICVSARKRVPSEPSTI